ncbi:MAG: hypothetical protein JWN37_132 [Candidatus Nomurabacteria bacterium]|nr:hypothetical protein [Candidatus Nomurabacteria bacterium]
MHLLTVDDRDNVWGAPPQIPPTKQRGQGRGQRRRARKLMAQAGLGRSPGYSKRKKPSAIPADAPAGSRGVSEPAILKESVLKLEDYGLSHATVQLLFYSGRSSIGDVVRNGVSGVSGIGEKKKSQIYDALRAAGASS